MTRRTDEMVSDPTPPTGTVFVPPALAEEDELSTKELRELVDAFDRSAAGAPDSRIATRPFGRRANGLSLPVLSLGAYQVCH